MPDFKCENCGTSFSLPQHVIDRYPGWTPRTCQACRSGKAGAAPPKAGPPQAGRRARPLHEENLPVAEVLAKYHDGPQTGVFTDGSANPNPGPGGWGAVYVVDGEVIAQAHGASELTTNNRMELVALREGVKLVAVGIPAVVYTDSRLVVDTVTKWAASWERNGWQRKGGPVQNLELVKEVYTAVRSRPEITVQWIPAHSGARWNEYADSLSTAYLREEL